MKEIVAAQIGGIITNDLTEIKRAWFKKTLSRLFTRKEVQALASLDLGKNWEALSKAPTLMTCDNNNKNFVIC